MADYATLKVRPNTKKVTTRLASKYEMNMLDFIESMAEYFDKTGVNPKDLQILSPAEELKKFRDTIVSFLRKQEKDFILPVFSRMDTMMARFIQYIDHEAPKKDNVPTTELKKEMSIGLNEMTPKKVVVQETEKESQIEEKHKKLKADYDELELKYKTIKKYFSNVMDNVTVKSTGFNKLPVIDNVSQADIDDYKQYLKRF